VGRRRCSGQAGGLEGKRPIKPLPLRLFGAATTRAEVTANDQAQQARGPSKLHIWESLRAPAVCCSAWFGVPGSHRCFRP
jgi:hypothetical protein